MIELRDVELAVGGRPLLHGLNRARRAGRVRRRARCQRRRKDDAAARDRRDASRPARARYCSTARRAASLRRWNARDAWLSLPATRCCVDALRVRDVVSIGRFPYHRWWEWSSALPTTSAVDRALAAVRIEVLRERLFSTLSAGERQRVWIALGLAQETPILLLDEPTSHLDVRVAHEILALVARIGARR